MYLNSQLVGLRGLSVPLSLQDLLDVELADDTALYLDGTEHNLQCVEKAISTFCIAVGAKINWNKSKAFWVNSNSSTYPH